MNSYSFIFCLILFISLFGNSLADKSVQKTKRKNKFYIGRVPPGRFEYPKLNGLYKLKTAVKVCDQDLSCGGFTFRGTPTSTGGLSNHEYDVYFFHFVPEEVLFYPNQSQFRHWSSYRVTSRTFVELRNVKPLDVSKREHCNEKNNGMESIRMDYSEGLKFGKKSLSEKNMASFFASKDETSHISLQYFDIFDFSSIHPSASNDDTLVVNLNSNLTQLRHVLPKIDRCCKKAPDGFIHQDVDSLERISCEIPKDEFFNKYVKPRNPVMMLGCQDSWNMTTWTLEGLINRFPDGWQTVYYNHTMKEPMTEMISGKQVFDMWKDGVSTVKVFQRLSGSYHREIRHLLSPEIIKELKLDLLYDYSHPKPFPDDIYLKYRVTNNQAYVMIGNSGSGTKMHLDPEATDAWNACLKGNKMWVYLAKDLYEFDNDLSCDPDCSDPLVMKGDIFGAGGWIYTILPQLKGRIYYGSEAKMFIQHAGETLYMPNLIQHTVYNLDDTFAFGENLLFDNGIEETAKVLHGDKMKVLLKMIDNDLQYNRIKAVTDQIARSFKSSGPKK